MAEHNTGTPRTSVDLLTNFFQGGQANNAITSQDMRDAIASIPHISVQGWQFFFDVNAIDIASAKLITEAGGRTQIEIAPFVSEDLLYPPGSPLAWNSSLDEDGSGILNRINPQLLNGFGLLRLSFAAWQNASDTFFDLEFDVSADGLSNTIYTATEVFHKGTGSASTQHFNFVIPVFLGSDFSTNGGRFYITTGGTGTNDIECFQITLTLAQTFAPNPAGPG